MNSLTLKNLLAHKRRLLSMFLAVVLGVAFLTGILVLTDTGRQTFDDLFAGVNRGTDAYVRSATKIDTGFGNEVRGRIPASLVATVRGVDGVKAAEGQVLGYGQIVSKEGKALGNPGMGAPTFAGSWLTVQELNPFRLSEGRAPASGNEVVIDKKSADDGHLAVGDQTTLLTAAGPVQVRVVGIVKFGEENSPGGASFALLTLDSAQRYVAKPGELDSIPVVGASGVSQRELASRIDKALPPDTETITGAKLT